MICSEWPIPGITAWIQIKTTFKSESWAFVCFVYFVAAATNQLIYEMIKN